VTTQKPWYNTNSSTLYLGSSITNTLVVNKGSMSLSISAPASLTYSNGLTTAVNGVQLGGTNFPTVSASPNQLCTLSNIGYAGGGTPAGPTFTSLNNLSVLGAGTITITASSPASALFNGATNTAKIVVAKGPQTINFPALVTKPVGVSQPLQATTSSGLPITYSVIGSGTITNLGGTITVTSSTTNAIKVVASQAGNSNFLAATPITNTLTTSPIQVGVVITNTTQTYSGNPSPVMVTTSVPGVSTKITYNGATNIPVNAGSYSVVATVTQPNYIGSSSTTLTINKASQTMIYYAPERMVAGASQVLRASAPTGLPITFTADQGSISNGVYTSDVPGQHVITATLAGNNNYLPLSVSKYVDVTAK
jgi:hypothetical protein